jgi:hypothetical protein
LYKPLDIDKSVKGYLMRSIELSFSMQSGRTVQNVHIAAGAT